MTRRDTTTPPADWHLPPPPKRAGADDPGGIFAPRPIRGREAKPVLHGTVGTWIELDATGQIEERERGPDGKIGEWRVIHTGPKQLQQRITGKPKPRPVNRYTPAK